MSSKLINFNGELQVLETISQHLKNNQPIVIATDTQWGICALDAKIVNKLKRRGNKEVIQLVDKHYHNIFSHEKNDVLKSLCNKFIDQFWPGQVTIIYDGISYRRTNAKYLNQIIDNLNFPVYCSSANITSNQPIKSASEALDVFNSTEFDILVVVSNDYQIVSHQIASTIIDVNQFKIIRRGTKIDEVEAFVKAHTNKQ